MKPKLLILTDLGLLKAYRVELTPQGTPHLDLLEEIVLEDAHQRLGERLTDLSGRHSGTVQRGGATTMADSHNLELEFKRRLLKQIAGKVDALVTKHGQDGCWLAAHKDINGMLLDELPRPVRELIQANVPRNLTKMDAKGLVNQFSEALPAGL